MEKVFYLTSRHGDCGTNVMFHNKGGAGYGSDLDNLRLYSIEDAQKELGYDINSLPLLKGEVDKLSIQAVDCQYLNSDKDDLTKVTGECVIQIDRNWNGNDIAFVGLLGMTYNYTKARKFLLKEAITLTKSDPIYKVWSVAYLNTICRRTFQRENISTRKMITGAGIRYKKPRKQRPKTGKTRWNCPTCGKISWQFNPYDFDGCGDYSCDSYGIPYSGE